MMGREASRVLPMTLEPPGTIALLSIRDFTMSHPFFLSVCRSLLVAVTLAAWLATGHASAAGGGAERNPDFTLGETIPEGAKHDWNLGPTGARGWMYSERLTTLKARQIYVTAVDEGSPADGVLRVGDVILGVDGEPFTTDARVEFAQAITAAETRAGRGALVVTRWRDGKSREVTVRLPVLGSYSATAPYGCEKSRRVFKQGCETLAETMADPKYRVNPMVRSLNAIALLASGDDAYLPLIKREAEWAAGYQTNSFESWWYGYALMFMSEYVIATGDDSIMPGLKRMALEVANGQSLVGSWGHGFVGEDGVLTGYGMMHSPGVPLTIALVLSREAGVDDPAVDRAIELSTRLIRFYVGKGSIPYGDHVPWTQTHDDNGKNGMAAVLFRLLGDREAAEYFSRMSVACHSAERDTGHSSIFWNITWAMPAVNLSGPHATGAWMNQFGDWYFDLARQWDGGFIHQGAPQAKNDRTNRWDTTGANLLAYAMPLKKLRVTGKGKQVVPNLSKAEATSLIEDGLGWNNLDRNSFYDALSTELLLDRLGSWSPIVRERAAMAFGRRKAEVTDQIIEMLRSEDRYERYGACKALRYLRSDFSSAVPVLMDAFKSDDLWQRILVADALSAIGSAARPAVPALLTRLANPDFENDPRGMEQRYLSFAIFQRRGGLLKSLDGIDRDLLREAIREGLQNQDGRARGQVANIFDQLTLDEIRPLLPAILDAVAEPAPSGIMFAGQVRIEGLRLLAKHNVYEGMQAGMDYLANEWDMWGARGRNPKLVEHLAAFGGNARELIPQLEALAERMENEPNRVVRARGVAPQIRQAIEAIKVSDHTPEMIRLSGPQSQ
jgi:hypothetical protein